MTNLLDSLSMKPKTFGDTLEKMHLNEEEDFDIFNGKYTYNFSKEDDGYVLCIGGEHQGLIDWDELDKFISLDREAPAQIHQNNGLFKKAGTDLYPNLPKSVFIEAIELLSEKTIAEIKTSLTAMSVDGREDYYGQCFYDAEDEVRNTVINILEEKKMRPLDEDFQINDEMANLISDYVDKKIGLDYPTMTFLNLDKEINTSKQNLASPIEIHDTVKQHIEELSELSRAEAYNFVEKKLDKIINYRDFDSTIDSFIDTKRETDKNQEEKLDKYLDKDKKTSAHITQ